VIEELSVIAEFSVIGEIEGLSLIGSPSHPASVHQ
jgi:hypothetical protein